MLSPPPLFRHLHTHTMRRRGRRAHSIRREQPQPQLLACSPVQLLRFSCCEETHRYTSCDVKALTGRAPACSRGRWRGCPPGRELARCTAAGPAGRAGGRRGRQRSAGVKVGGRVQRLACSREAKQRWAVGGCPGLALLLAVGSPRQCRCGLCPRLPAQPPCTCTCTPTAHLLSLERVNEGHAQRGVLVQQDVHAPRQPPALGAAAVPVGGVHLSRGGGGRGGKEKGG